MRDGDMTYRPRDVAGRIQTPDVDATQTIPPEESQKASDVGQVRRDGDTTYRPRDFVDDIVRQIPPKNIGAATSEDETPAAVTVQRGEKGAENGSECGPTWMVSSAIVLFALLISAVTVKFTFLLREAFELPVVLRELALVGIVFVFLVLLYSVIALVKALKKLPKIEQAANKDSSGKRISERERRRLLERYVNEALASDPKGYEEELGQTGCAKKIKNLLDGKSLDNGEWMKAFGQIVTMQDDAADKRIRSRYIKVFLKTGASPWKIIDAVAVMYHSVGLALDIAKIYRRRVTRFQAFRLAAEGLVAIAISSVAQEGAEKVFEVCGGLVHETVVSKFLKGIMAKASEGALNAVFVCRLGNRLKSRFRPIVEKLPPPMSHKTKMWKVLVIVFLIVALLIVAGSLSFRFYKG